MAFYFGEGEADRAGNPATKYQADFVKRNLEIAAGERESKRAYANHLLMIWRDNEVPHIARTLKRREVDKKKEIRLLNMELTMVRRAALRTLLECERRQYQEEFNRMGKAFYVLRI